MREKCVDGQGRGEEKEEDADKEREGKNLVEGLLQGEGIAGRGRSEPVEDFAPGQARNVLGTNQENVLVEGPGKAMLS